MNGKHIILFLISFLLLNSCQESVPVEPDEILDIDSLYLIPSPLKLQKSQGFFTLDQDTYLNFHTDLANEGNYLANLIDSSSLFKTKVNFISKIPVKNITLELTDLFPDHLQHGEAYILTVSEEQILIKALSTTGIMRGIQTLRQLMVPAFHRGEKRDSWYIPALEIEDVPAFEHRGLLLDVCRHFFDKKVIFKYLDAMAFYKMNVLHFHLTEDQGWRIEIDKYPRLNKISSWRTEENGERYGGYYTKEDLKEIVTYAAERHIVVIPEIELPGHAQAALAAYPEFSCNGGPIEVANDWGVFKEIYCAGNDSTFIFLEDILSEVMEIFPSEYIHIGGDEAPKFRWEHCSKCQKRMKDEGLRNEHELQAYFIQRIESFLNSKGRKLIGWDEILEGGLSENATVQSWRGMDGGIKAAEQEHYVIMSPTSHCYLDYGLSSIDLEKIYSFDPIPTDLNRDLSHYIIGAECNMWTEHVPDEQTLDEKVFPRMIALSEVLWSYRTDRTFDEFYKRIQFHYPLLKAFGIHYGLEAIGATITSKFSDKFVRIEVNKNLNDLNLMYSWDSLTWLDYKGPIELHNNGTFYVQAYKHGETYGLPVSQEFVHHKGLNHLVNYFTAYNSWYIGNDEKNLVDGKIGSLDFRDGNWQGFWGEDIDLVMDLGENTDIENVQANFYQYANSWIFAPVKVEIAISVDSANWKSIYRYSNADINLSNVQEIITVSTGSLNEKGRYIRFSAINLGKVPKGHEAEGSDAWLFIDEIIVN